MATGSKLSSGCPPLAMVEETESTLTRPNTEQHGRYHVKDKIREKHDGDVETGPRECILREEAEEETVSSSTSSSWSSPSTSTLVASWTSTEPSLDSKAVYPQYRHLQSRLDSYQKWEWSDVQDPQVLSGAGFYYAGYRDCVRCFYCGVGLRTWEREDDPWVEHVRWRSSCDYVRFMKGEKFVVTSLDPSKGSISFASSTHDKMNTNEKPLLTNGRTEDTKVLNPIIGKINVSVLSECLNTMKHNETISHRNYNKCDLYKKNYDIMDKTYRLVGIDMCQSLITCPFVSLRGYFEDMQTQTPTNPKEHYEGFRLMSFKATNVAPSAIVLAEAGFSATGDEDEVKCFSCGATKRNWQLTDDPRCVHQPNCRHLTRGDERNVPICQRETDVTIRDPTDNATAAVDRYLTEDVGPGIHQDTHLGRGNNFIQQNTEPSDSSSASSFNHQLDYCHVELNQRETPEEAARQSIQSRSDTQRESGFSAFRADQVMNRLRETGSRMSLVRQPEDPVPMQPAMHGEGGVLSQTSATSSFCRVCRCQKADILLPCGHMVICKECSRTCSLRRCPYC